MSKYKLYILSLIASLASCIGNCGTIAAPIAITSEISLESQAQFYHSQDRKLLGATLKDSLRQAKESILIFTFSLSDPEIIETLNQQVAAGLMVTVVIDRDHLVEINHKKDPKLEVVTRPTGEGHLHHKILVVDGSEIWIGSANFTKSAYQSQENLMARFTSAELGLYLRHEADVFRGKTQRSAHGPLLISLLEQEIYFCLLPHDGFPPKKIEQAMNDLSKKLLIDRINQAQTNIHIAMMVWTNNDLTTAVIEAQKRGVKVQVVAPDLGGNLPKLMSAGIEVKVNPKLGLMHNKLMCIDNQILVNGSANWSQSSFTRSDESFVIIEPMTVPQSENFSDYWSYLFGQI